MIRLLLQRFALKLADIHVGRFQHRAVFASRNERHLSLLAGHLVMAVATASDKLKTAKSCTSSAVRQPFH